MIRFIILCLLFFLLYIGFNAISEYDSQIVINVVDYQVTTTLFAAIAIFFLVQFGVIVILKLAFLMFDLPSILKNRWYKRKLIRINSRLLQVLSELIMGNKKKSLKTATNILAELDDDNKDFVNLVMAESEDSFDKRIQYYRNLIDKKSFSAYSLKKLAEIFYENSHYAQAEEFALKAFNQNDTDPELMLLIIRIYASLAMWPKIVFIATKLMRADNSVYENNAKELAVYYFSAAKHSLQSGSDKDALKYIESALECYPGYLEALNLYMELLANTNNSASILKVLKVAFQTNPSFEIARMFADSSRSSAEAIYGTLASIAQPAKYQDLFLALASYLGLKDKVIEAKESTKLIAYESGVK